MAEVAESASPDLQVLSVRRYEAAPSSSQSQELVDPESTYATTKEEEWVTKKKTELTTTRQIETRVKRQVVLEDGKVVDDSGPIVTTNTTEDTEKQESKQTEHRTIGEDPPGENWVAVAGPSGTLKEVKERKVTTREEKEERVETEDVKHHGDITDEDYLTAVKSQQDIRLVLREAREESNQQDKQLVSANGPRVVHQSTKSHKVIDTEDTQELSQLQPDGRLVTETRRTTEHEEVHDAEEPDDKVDGGEGSETEETFKESTSRYAKTKDQDLVEYLADGVKIGEEMRYVAETVEGERRGDPDLADQEWDSLSTRIRRMRRQSAKTRGIPAAVGHLGEPTALTPLDRKDALTKKPLDFDQEEETRKVETSKWLEHHFGSDSRSSKDSIEDDDIQASGTNTSFINVTMKSRPISSNRKASTLTSPNGNSTASATATTPKSYVATVNTSSRVFVSSPEPEDQPANGAGGFFQGVSEWSERSKEVRSPSAPQRPERVQVLPTGPNHTFTPKTADVGYNNHVERTSPYPHTNHVSEKTSVFQASNSSSTHNVSRASPYPTTNHLSPDRSVSYMNGSPGRVSPYPTGRVSPYNKTVRVAHNESSVEDEGYHPSRRRSPTPRLRFSDREEREGEDTVDGYRFQSSYRTSLEKDGPYRSWERSGQETEPPPDYSPEQPHRGTPSASPSPPPDIRSTPPPEATSSKKLYRRPRVNAEIPPPPSPATSAAPTSTGRHGKSSGHSATSIIGESFRKLVGKFRTSSSERKAKRRSAGGKRGSNHSRSPSPRHQPGYNVTDSSGSSSIPGSKAQRVGRRGGEESPLPNEAGLREAEGGESSDHRPVAPPRSARAHQVSSRHYRARGEPAMQRRFYLGEDPFGGSIYGREREYDGVTPLKSSRRHHRQQNGHRRGSHPGEEDDMNRANVSSSSLGRLSKSTSRLATAEQVTPGATIDYSRTAQTLPRKLYDEHTQTSRLKKQVYLQKNGGTKQPHSSSMINVSIINNVTPPPSSLGVSKPLSNGVSASTGPAKPARTYRSSLARSKSFNVHAGEPGDSPSFQFGNRFRDSSTIYKSNPHLHRLDESPPPLKSPGILASISRSQRDLSDSATIEKEDSFTRRPDQPTKFSKSTSNLITNGYGNQNINVNGSSQEAKKRLFMRELMDRAPELYKTLHGSDDDNDLKQPDRKTSRSPVGRMYSSTPLKNGLSSNRVLDYSSSFRSSSTNATPPEGDTLRSGGRPLSSPFRSSTVNGGERVTSPSGSKSSFSSSLTHTPSYTNGGRRGSSSNDDYSETVRITSKLDDPVRPSVTNTVQSFTKKTIPRKGGLSTETIESTETTTVTKSRLRGGDGNGSLQYLDNGDGKYALRNGGGAVVIEVRPTRK